MDSVAITGVWLRTIKHYPGNERGEHETEDIEVLVEIDGRWRKVIEEISADQGGPISHIVEVAGITKAPLDTVVTANTTTITST
jgi:hypothetical protein